MIDLRQMLEDRFGRAPEGDLNAPDLVATMVARGSCRAFQSTPVPVSQLEMLSAIALASPTKSDLQQRDIILITDTRLQQRLASLVGDQSWVASAPNLVVFCANNRRQRLLHKWRDLSFANDHLDAFFNATVDAAVALGAFVSAAEAMGLCCCPISALRNQPVEVSRLLNLPDHVFPVAGLAIGYSGGPTEISKRLPLNVTIHHNSYQEDDLQAGVMAYAAERARAQPYARQRSPERFGTRETYDWVEDKVRQYNLPERDGFGKFVRRKGFKLD